MALVRQALITTTGTQDFTFAGFGTPHAARFFLGSAIANNTVTDHLRISDGCADGTNQWVVAGDSEDGLTAPTTTDTGKQMTTTQAVMSKVPGGTIEGEASFSAFITDGVRINITDAFPAAYLLTVVLYKNLQGDACIVFTANATQDAATDVTTVGFQADTLFVVTHSEDNDDSNSTNFIYSTGIVLSDGTQMSQVLYDDDSVTTTDVRSTVNTTRGAQFLAANGNASGTLEFGSFDASGFTATTRAAAAPTSCGGGCEVAVFAVKWATGFSQALVQLDSPTSTGARSVTFPGFLPTFAMYLTNDAALVNSQNTDAEAFGLSLSTAADRYAMGWRSDDGVSTSDTGDISQATWVRVNNGAGTTIFQATFSGFTSTGWDETFSTTDTGTARQWIAYALQESAPLTQRLSPLTILLGR